MQEMINAMAAIVTTGRKISPDSVTLAQAAAARLQIPYVERRTAGLPALKKQRRCARATPKASAGAK